MSPLILILAQAFSSHASASSEELNCYVDEQLVEYTEFGQSKKLDTCLTKLRPYSRPSHHKLYQLLTKAVLHNNSSVIKVILEHHPDIVNYYYEGYPPLLISAMNKPYITRVLKSYGADINGGHIKPLEHFIGQDDMDMVKKLVAIGADIHGKPDSLRTPLMNAAADGNLRMVKYLVEQGADVKVETAFKDSAVRDAAYGGHLEVVQYLMSKGAKKGDWELGPTYVSIHAIKNNVKGVQALLELGVHPNDRDPSFGQTPLHYAARRGFKTIVSLLLKYGANPHTVNNYGMTPVQDAQESGHSEIVEIFSDRRLIDAVQSQDLDQVRDALDQGAVPNTRGEFGQTALYWAAYRGLYEITELLLSSHALIEITNYDGETALFAAVRKGHLNIVELLLERGASPEAVDRFYKKPIDWAREKGLKEIENLLLKDNLP